MVELVCFRGVRAFARSHHDHRLTNQSMVSIGQLPPGSDTIQLCSIDSAAIVEDVEFPTLVAVNGEVSLRKCFEYFEEVDYNHHKRFFRHLGIVDNVIKSKDHLSYEDKIHDLLTIWVEKEGREATLNDLLRALLILNQRRTAETVKEKAVLNGHYSVER
ncbi:hypothetical protein VZT92_019548 [Zoarces viviparus]|uniref:Death domain-containing protein n=1 Tax=Zoarces viviparus TaxID=48416 RepID=A0AAW1EKJ7_ZOAVI